MKKTYKMFLALVLCVLGAVSVNAETISLQEVPYGKWNGWGADAQMTEQLEPAWVVEESTGQPYGDASVINYADLSNFNKLIVVATEGTPRFMLNRDIDEGQFNADETQSHLIEYPKCIGTWAEKYFTLAAGDNEGETVYTVNLKQIAKDKGFAHLHAIKGANWNNTTVLSMVVERTAKAPVGWTSVINNGNMEGDDVSSFPVALNAVNVSGVQDATIEDGVGVNDSRAIVITSLAGATETWATQLFVKANEALPEGTKWRFSMDVKADDAAHITTGAHAEPRTWLAGGIISEFDVNSEWTKIEAEGTVSADLGGKSFQSIAFDLNNDKDNARTFYFDNINFEVFKLGTVAEFRRKAINLDFGFDTNIAELVKKSGKPRLIYPEGCATVTVDGDKADIVSVEGFADGHFFIFVESGIDEESEVVVSFKNPTDAAYQIVYASGAVNGQVVGDVDALVATYIENWEGVEQVYPYVNVIPTVVKADPEDGAFNLPNSIKEFKFWFDKNVDCAQLTATLNGNALKVQPASGVATEITLVREGADLVTGEYTLKLDNIFAEEPLNEESYGDTTLVLNIGKAEYDPNDVVKELIPAEYFGDCAANTIPEGFFVKMGDGDRPSKSSQGSGSRMFNFAEGGDFTKGLYFREGYVEYGTTVDEEAEGGPKEYALTLEAGKKYEISFNSAMWKDNGTQMCFRLYLKEDFDAAIALEEEPTAILTQVVTNTPNVNGGTGAVNGSAKTLIKFQPEVTGKYVIRWVSTGSETGGLTEYKEVILANPSVKYIPNQAGIELVQELENALADAKSTRAANTDERYDGADFSALDAAIVKYEAEKDGYYNPSAYKDAAADLNALAQAMKDHRALCDDYDAAIKKTIDVERQNKELKFNKTELFAQVVELNAKYHGTSEWVNVAEPNPEDPEAEVEPVWQLNYSFDVLKENEALATAIAELKDLANVTSLLFTEGVSSPEGANNGKGTGVAVAFDRIRRGLATLEALGVDKETDELYQYANSALTDDDEIADKIKNRIKMIIYKNAQEVFKPVVDEETLEEGEIPSYEMTVFVKNPNLYKTQPNMNFDEENVPGWTTPEGYNKPGLSTGWGAAKHIEGVFEDCMFQTWGGSYRVEQTIADLPVGTYTLYFGFSDRDSNDDLSESFAFAKTAETLEGEDGFTASIDAIGQAFPFAEGSGSAMIENVTVTDGMLTLGVNAGDGTHTFFNDVHIYMTGIDPTFDYVAAYEELVQGIETAKATTVRNVEIYDLNGRRVATAARGISIMKKHMNDGSVRIVKVVKK